MTTRIGQGIRVAATQSACDTHGREAPPPYDSSVYGSAPAPPAHAYHTNLTTTTQYAPWHAGEGGENGGGEEDRGRKCEGMSQK